MNFKTNKGFTLIELLVVIAIIGILSSVVLASLNTARDKGRDAAVQSSMQTIRVQAELYYDDNGNTYGTDTGACTGGMFGDGTIDSAVTEIGNVAASGGVVCDATDQSWAMTADLNSGNFWCTDSTGVATEKATALAANTDCSY